jgi:solute carrier family 31 (copper transporter), member 1
MLFNMDTTGLCIVFKSWRITGPISLALSLVAIVLLCAGYELIREISRRVEAKHAAQLSGYSTSGSSTYSPLLETGLNPALNLGPRG